MGCSYGGSVARVAPGKLISGLHVPRNPLGPRQTMCQLTPPRIDSIKVYTWGAVERFLWAIGYRVWG